MPSPFGVNTFGTSTGFNIFTVIKSVAVQPNSPVAISVYFSSAVATSVGFSLVGSLRPSGGSQLKVSVDELAIAVNCTVVPCGTTNELPASITGCKCTVTV